MSATCWLWFASCQWGIPISLRPPLPFIFLFTIHLTTYRGGRILVISCWIGNLTRSLTSNGDSDPRAFQLTASRGGWRSRGCTRNTRRYFNSQPHEEADRTWFAQLSEVRIFQLTVSRGGWLQIHLLCRTWLYFNSQPHEEADADYLIAFAPMTHFNSQPHEEADRICFVRSPRAFSFQLTASRGGWHLLVILVSVGILFQLTASRGGWLAAYAWRICYMLISTHSLTRRLAFHALFHAAVRSISTHSLTRRLTMCPSNWCMMHSISTHSLTRRLTVST